VDEDCSKGMKSMYESYRVICFSSFNLIKSY
jgi:hypothetical protein